MKVPVHSRSSASRAQRGADTRASILAAAARIFARSGLDGARTEAIASAAGVNKAMLYYYFKSKDQLYSAVLESNFKEFHRHAIEVLSAKASAPAIVLRFVETHFDFISSQRDYSRLFQQMMMADFGHGERLIRKYLAPISRKLIEVIELGQRNGEFRRFDSHHAAISLVALNVFYFAEAPVMRIIARVDPYSAANLKRRKEEVLRFIRYGLFREPEAPV